MFYSWVHFPQNELGRSWGDNTNPKQSYTHHLGVHLLILVNNANCLRFRSVKRFPNSNFSLQKKKKKKKKKKNSIFPPPQWSRKNENEQTNHFFNKALPFARYHLMNSSFL